MPLYFAAAALALSTVATGVSAVAQKHAAEDQQKVQAAQSYEQRQGETRRKVREQRITAARIKQSASNVGAGGSSGEAGALGSLSSQFATGASAAQFAQQSSDKLGQIQTSLARSQSKAAGIQIAGSLLGGVAEYKQSQIPPPKT